ncbi:UDP-glucuronosyltransferase 2C1-like isoform X2 [Lineus longissimus]
MNAGRICLVLLALVLLAVSPTKGKKVLLIGFPFTSHMNELMAVGRELVSKGHQVYAIMDVNKLGEKRFQGTGLKFLTYDSLDKEQKAIEEVEEKWPEICFRTQTTSIKAMMDALASIIQPIGTYECSRMLSDDKLLQQIRDVNFDISLLDAIYYCSYLIPFKLDIPYVSMGSFNHVWKSRLHPVASHQPCKIERDNSFTNRLKHFFLGMIVEHNLPDLFMDQSKFLDYDTPRPYSSLSELVEKSSLFLINQNTVGSCAAPSTPNVIYVGGLTNKPAKPLNVEYSQIVAEARDGVIVMSFGSGMSKMPKEFVRKFMWAFAQIKQVVIWRLKTTYDLEVPPNVNIVDWMPQNDLLADDRVQLFITHCGNNGQYEAIYHGVPMIGSPLYGDQADNAARMVHKGYGLQIQIASFTAEELLEKINEVIRNPKYRANMKIASKIHKSLPDPIRQSVYWIEHVMEHGDGHLRTVLSEMSPTEFLMFDIFAVLFVLLGVVAFLLKLLLCFVYRKLSGSGSLSDRSKKQN